MFLMVASPCLSLCCASQDARCSWRCLMVSLCRAWTLSEWNRSHIGLSQVIDEKGRLLKQKSFPFLSRRQQKTEDSFQLRHLHHPMRGGKVGLVVQHSQYGKVFLKVPAKKKSDQSRNVLVSIFNSTPRVLFFFAFT